MAKVHEHEDVLLDKKHLLEVWLAALPPGQEFSDAMLARVCLALIEDNLDLRKQLNRAQFGRFA